ncbi:Oidioi.mRNA.OKI2018_I69.chr2.g8292.t1.cds [Oikopleura dioica]|uniref:Oidioi.mRNA.OKI2018_I69.chr2.g8292.t1.cds n=1 Tax=Oikopleura dioica TaxID=34765 RepID=A0ABN7T9A1_OIKDI|nr:Oidioi.mRNA.OKI2018_I69.chr2.g8292.t1.cds [Oikopleura dioica]
MLISYGDYGKCVGSECDGVPTGTVEIEGRRLCETCETKEYGSDSPETENCSVVLSYRESDAKFKCLAYNDEESCKSKEVSFKDFFLGTCCEPASKVLVENEKAQEKQLNAVHYFYEDELNSLRGTKDAYATSKAKITRQGRSIKRHEGILEQLKKQAEEAEKKLIEAKKKVVDEEKLIEKKKKYVDEKKQENEYDKEDFIHREKEKNAVLKRFKQLSYEFHPVAAKLSLDEEVDAKESRKDFQYCKGCNEDYNDTDRQKSFLARCGHVACYECFKDEADDEDHPYCPLRWARDCQIKFHLHQVKPLYE